MGMYDSFYDKESKCPKCQANIDEWQSKKLESLVEVWKKGDFLQYRRLESIPEKERRRKYGDRKLATMFRRTNKFHSNKPLVQNGQIPVHTSCKNCQAWLEGYAKILNGHFVGIVEAEATKDEKEMILIKPETTAMSLRGEFEARLLHLQESCKHEKRAWRDVLTLGHFFDKEQICLRCEEVLRTKKDGLVETKTLKMLREGNTELTRGKFKSASSQEEIERILSG